MKLDDVGTVCEIMPDSKWFHENIRVFVDMVIVKEDGHVLSLWHYPDSKITHRDKHCLAIHNFMKELKP